MAHWQDEKGQGLVSYGLVLFLAFLISFLIAWFLSGTFVKGGLWCSGFWVALWLLGQISGFIQDLIAKWRDS